MMRNIKLRNIFISVFVLLWTVLFHYESLRYFYLNKVFKKELPKTKFLFPPAGWIMFFNVDDQYGGVEVFGVKDNVPEFIDPHLIFRTRTIGFDNIHRNILSTVGHLDQAQPFCRFMKSRFSYYDKLIVTVVIYPSLTKEPHKKIRQIQYQCLMQ